MSDVEVIVVRTGTANLASILSGLKRAGANAKISKDANEIELAKRVLLPGVGTFGAAMYQLEKAGLVEILRERIKASKPTMAVCLGLQMLCETSEESPGLKGLCAVPAKISKFSDNVRVPQLGWNNMVVDEGCKLLQSGYVYFANSYRLEHVPEGWNAAITDYDGKFVAAMERGPVLACQFHPELSSTFGIQLISRWIETGGQ